MYKLLVFIITVFFLQSGFSAESNKEISSKLIKDAKKTYKKVVKLNNAWRDTQKIIKKAEKAHSNKKYDKSTDLAKKALNQAKMAIEQHNSQKDPEYHSYESDLDIGDLLPKNQALHQRFIDTLQKILPHLGKDESKVVSALIILALKLEGVIGKDLSEKDSKMIEILKDYIMNDDEKKDSVMKIAERFNISNQS